MSGGGERMPMRQLPFKHLQLQGLLTVIAVTDNCLSFSVKGNLETFSVKILVAAWCVCVWVSGWVGVCVCALMQSGGGGCVFVFQIRLFLKSGRKYF